MPLQDAQPHFVEVLIVADPFRRAERPLAAPSQMLRETVSNVRVDLSKGHARISEVEVVLPACEVPVQSLISCGIGLKQ